MHSIVLNKTQQEWVTVSERETKASETGIGGSLVYRQLEISVYTSTGGSYIASLKYQCTQQVLVTLVYSQLEIPVYTTSTGGSLVYRQLEISVYTTSIGDSLVNS